MYRDLFAFLTFFAYVCYHIKDSKDMKDNVKTPDIIYANRLTNVVLKDGELLETIIKQGKNDLPIDTIFDIFARILAKNAEQRKILYHIIFDKAEYNRNTLSKKCSSLYGKSDRTYQRAIDYLFGRKIIYQDRNRTLKVPVEYDLSLLDLEKVKSVIIHIN